MESARKDTTNITNDQSWASCDVDASKLEACSDTVKEPRASGLQVSSDRLELTIAGDTYTVTTVMLVVVGLVVVASLITAAVFLNRSRK